LQRALSEEMRRNPGREKEVAELYRSNPAAVSRLRAPLFEDKVIDFLMELVDVTDRQVTREELIALIEADDTGPDDTKAD
jgi:trigger factor